MQLRCDLHLHSCLSPCADLDMVPANLIGMAMVNELDLIAITDHQSCGNAGAAMRAAEALNGPLVLPGIEAESSEEIHLICLFAELDAALGLEREIRVSMPRLPNKPHIFGRQLLVNEEGEIIGEEPDLLVVACALDAVSIAALTASLGGICVPAHLDRQANSMLGILGAIPPEFPARWAELSRAADEYEFRKRHPELASIQLMRNSDAHHLADIADPGWLLEIDWPAGRAAQRQAVIAALRGE